MTAPLVSDEVSHVTVYLRDLNRNLLGERTLFLPESTDGVASAYVQDGDIIVNCYLKPGEQKTYTVIGLYVETLQRTADRAIARSPNEAALIVERWRMRDGDGYAVAGVLEGEVDAVDSQPEQRR